MRITKRQLKRIIREEQAGITKKYDDDSALIGDQSKLSDPLQKAIIDKTVEDREEAKEKETKEKSESIRITKTQLQQIIKEEGYYSALPKKHIDGQVWGGSLEDLAYHQGRAWGHGDVVDPKGFKGCVQKGQRLAQGKDGSPLQMTEAQLRRTIRGTLLREGAKEHVMAYYEQAERMEGEDALYDLLDRLVPADAVAMDLESLDDIEHYGMELWDVIDMLTPEIVARIAPGLEIVDMD